MSAKVIRVSSLDSIATRGRPSDAPARAPSAAEVQFRGALWCEYEQEAARAGFSTAEAIAYANALILESGGAGLGSGLAPSRGDWFYQSGPRVVRRTAASGVVEFTRRRHGTEAGRLGAARASRLARKLRWWNTGWETAEE